jgi:hypothetical protein
VSDEEEEESGIDAAARQSAFLFTVEGPDLVEHVLENGTKHWHATGVRRMEGVLKADAPPEVVDLFLRIEEFAMAEFAALNELHRAKAPLMGIPGRGVTQ